MIRITCIDRDQAVAISDYLLRDLSLGCAVYSPAGDPDYFMVLDEAARVLVKSHGDDLTLEYNPERRDSVRVSLHVPVHTKVVPYARA